MSEVFIMLLQEYSNEVQIDSGVVVLDFYANWCGPCRAIAPRFEELSRKYGNVNFVKVNVDQYGSLAGKYLIQSMPTFVVLKDGVVIDTFMGSDKISADSNAASPLEQGLQKVISDGNSFAQNS